MAKVASVSKNQKPKKSLASWVIVYFDKLNVQFSTRSKPSVIKLLLVLVLIIVVGVTWNQVYEADGDTKKNLNNAEDASDMIINRDVPVGQEETANTSEEVKTYINPIESEPLTLSFMNEVKQELLKDEAVSEDNLVTLVNNDNSTASIWWEDDGYMVVVGGQTIIVEYEYLIENDNFHDYEVVINNDNFVKAQNITQRVLTDAGFSKTSNVGNDWDYTVGYQNKDYVCASISNPDILGPQYTTVTHQGGNVITYSLVCASKDEITDELNDKIPFLKAAKLKNTGIALSLIEDRNSRIKVFNGGPGRAGAAYTFYLEGSNWILINIGHEVISCQKLVTENIPEQYWISCCDNETNEVIEY